MFQHLHHGGAGRRRQQEIENLFEKNDDRKFPLSGEENRHTSQGSTESPKQDEPNEAHTKIHHS